MNVAAPNWSGAVGVDAAVLANVKALGPIHRDALSTATSIKVTTLCGALDRLIKRGLVAEATHKVYNPATRRNVKAYIPVHAAQPETDDA